MQHKQARNSGSVSKGQNKVTDQAEELQFMRLKHRYHIIANIWLDRSGIDPQNETGIDPPNPNNNCKSDQPGS